MNDNPTDLVDDSTSSDASIDTPDVSDDAFDDSDGLEPETEEELLRGLDESEEDIKAGRVRPARDAILDIAARYGIRLGE